ncbi:MAG: hypothetical protein ACTHM6_09730 [Tepidisphaeraceae bacterium]
MADSVLNLGEKIVLAARLAAVEHIRQEIEAAWAAKAVGTVGDQFLGFTEEPETPLQRPIGSLLGEVFDRIEKGAA